MNTRKKALAGTTAAALALGGFALGRVTQVERVQADPADSSAAAVTTPSGRALPSFASLAAQASPAVVYIKVVAVEKAAQPGPGFGFPPSPFGEDAPFSGFPSPFPPPPPGGFRHQGSGSGFIIRQDGVILTNNHVVEDAKEITVTLTDKREYSAKVMGRDPKTDLAVLKIEPKGDLPVAQLGDSDALRVGDWVMAIGNPFGLSNTVTAGIVSAKGRVIGTGPYDDFIQTDASINPGNSGGPLFNERGEVVGINSAIFSQSGGNIGIGFAIPINLAKRLLPELETNGSVTRGWLGVSIQKMTAELAQSLGVDEARGALVADVTGGSPAEKAGIARGDVIVAYNGKKVEDSSALPALVAATPVGKTVPVAIIREGKAKTLEVTVAKLAEPTAADEPIPQKSKWGLALRDLRPEERERMGLKEGEGVMVGGVLPDSPAAAADVQVGDVILQVNHTPIASVEELKKEAGKVTGDKPLLLLLRRADGNNRFATLAAK
ncbi:MAG: DegQ family serine endoprotease [Deltaproteobacteria bacterium]|nr:DegQ family serine endoprotease [Deltaproteobacteria bacterium]